MIMAESEPGLNSAGLRFAKSYDPQNRDIRERRRKLFHEIARNRTAETDAAMNKVAARFLGKFIS
jgi:hypothetical protein